MTQININTVEDLDFALLCDYPQHHSDWDSTPSFLALRHPLDCGCGPIEYLICKDCHTYISKVISLSIITGLKIICLVCKQQQNVYDFNYTFFEII